VLWMVVVAISFSVVPMTVNTEIQKPKRRLGIISSTPGCLCCNLQVDTPQATKEKNISFEPDPSKTCV
jgi:hypothetical protein